jgi:hypothetical protein
MTTLMNALEQRGGRYALQTMCAGGGMANATIIATLVSTSASVKRGRLESAATTCVTGVPSPGTYATPPGKRDPETRGALVGVGAPLEREYG